jgi:hypothetical protein
VAGGVAKEGRKRGREGEGGVSEGRSPTHVFYFSFSANKYIYPPIATHKGLRLMCMWSWGPVADHGR